MGKQYYYFPVVILLINTPPLAPLKQIYHMLKANKSADRPRSACSLLTAAVFIERFFSELPNLITLSRYARYAYSPLTAVVLSERLFSEPPHVRKGRPTCQLFNLIILFVLKKKS